MDSLSRVGLGVDTHRLNPGKGLSLGLVHFPCDFEIEAHSDGDVVVHAIIDSLLGAAALGDLGEYYPGNDTWKDASGDRMLRHCASVLQDAKMVPFNLDVTVICEKIRIKPYRQAMREALAEVLGMATSHVSVKATTTDGLGFAGRGEGIAAMCVSLIRPVTT